MEIRLKFDRAIERVMGMTDELWLRHANPWSVWTRIACVPAFALATWSRDWIGAFSLIPVALVVVFLWLNTRIFGPATDLDRWETRAILGEKIWLNRRRVPISQTQQRATALALTGSVAGILPAGLGLIWLDVGLTLLGVVVIVCGQIWFLTLLARLYDEVVPDRDRFRR